MPLQLATSPLLIDEKIARGKRRGSMSIDVYDERGALRARDFTWYEDAAAFVAFLGAGATVKSCRGR
jgi:hypothetical protein